MIQGLIFDFDGLILNTEASIYQSWQELYRSCGRELSFERFAQTIGTADNEPDLVAELEALVGKPLDQPRLAAWQRARESALILEQLPRPGVKDYLAGAKGLGLKVALASSSACSWATGHLSRLGFIQYFDAILAGDDVVHTKPDPALFLAALRALELASEEAIVFEDSAHGILAARRAGLFCVAVPTELTRRTDLSLADLQIESMAEIPLEELLELVNSRVNEE